MLNPDRLAAIYECLRQFPPFHRYSLPSCDEVHFNLVHKNDRSGDYISFIRDPTTHLIRINPDWNGHFDSVAMTMAHEMIHLHQRVKRLESRTEHNADFKAKARRICTRFGWDFKRFV